MKLVFCLIACFSGYLAITVAAESSAGYFVPKSFYRLDENGNKLSVHNINPIEADFLRRHRRDTYHSVSSSSSSFSSNGGPLYFTSQQAVQSSPSVQSRFGDEEITGHVIQTSGVIDKNGRVTYTTKQKKL